MVYLSNYGNVIADGLDAIVNGIKYVIDISNMENLKAYPLSELATLGETFDFICKNYPDYEHCDEAAWEDDLDCLLNGECDEEKTCRLTMQWGSDPDVWQTERDRLYSKLLNGAIENYKQSN